MLFSSHPIGHTVAKLRRPSSDLAMKCTNGKPRSSSTCRHALVTTSERTRNRPAGLNCSYLPSWVMFTSTTESSSKRGLTLTLTILTSAKRALKAVSTT